MMRKAFNLIELPVVIAVMGVFVSLLQAVQAASELNGRRPK
jgi:prepilin-type N-terminal cleavage/methylation domain-containing protein